MNYKSITIADTVENSSNAYWKLHIGKTGVWTNTSGDGLCDIAFDDPPIVVHGVNQSRFVVKTDDAEADGFDLSTPWRRFFRTMEVTGIVLGVIGIAFIVYWYFR